MQFSLWLRFIRPTPTQAPLLFYLASSAAFNMLHLIKHFFAGVGHGHIKVVNVLAIYLDIPRLCAQYSCCGSTLSLYVYNNAQQMGIYFMDKEEDPPGPSVYTIQVCNGCGGGCSVYSICWQRYSRTAPL